MSAFVPVILSGGAGTRLWPVSREALPKPFIKLPDGESLLQKTLKRAASLRDVAEIVTVTNRDHYFLTRDEYDLSTGLPPLGFLLEPFGRNTAPAIAAAALHVAGRHGADAVLLVLPADHLINDQAGFFASVEQARRLAADGWLVTFGIRPTAPETGFGYIEAGAKVGDGFKVARFVEKPSREKAADYLAAGNFTWNSGMFCFTAGAVLDALRVQAPELLAAVEATLAATDYSKSPPVLAAEPFRLVPDISIDYAVMEKAAGAGRVAVVPVSFDWSDIGSWNALAELTAADARGNRVAGAAVLVDAANCFVQGEERIVAAVGVDNLLIVDTADALLVADRGRAQDVKAVVQQLKLTAHASVRYHRTVHRPWGSYTVLEEGERFKIKRIVVKPGASLSLQMHHHRSEHWVVISGMARVVNGAREIYVSTDESTYIPAGTAHRLANPGVIDCVMIEVQTGDYVGEDDIVRLEDNYGRC